MRILRFSDLRPLGVTYCRPYLNRLVAAGKFPKPIALGDRHPNKNGVLTGYVGWDEGEIERWLETRKAERDHVE